MADAIKKTDKPAKNIVHEQAILVETIKKELREQKFYNSFSINPFTKSIINNSLLFIIIIKFHDFINKKRRNNSWEAECIP